MATLEKLFQETYRPTDQRKCVGNYVIGPILGQGRFSLVRCAVDIRDGQRVSVERGWRRGGGGVVAGGGGGAGGGVELEEGRGWRRCWG